MPDPALSVVLATRLRKRQLRLCLESLSKQIYSPGQWEVIVVHDGEDPESEQVVESFRSQLPIRNLRQSHAGCGFARNRGAAEARGEYVIFTDDDCILPPDWLSRYDACFRLNPGCMVAGPSRNWLPDNPYSQATQDIVDCLLQYSNPTPENAWVALGNNMGAPTADFLAMQGFSPRYYRTAAEDRDFCARWVAGGRRIVFDRRIVVLHAHELNLRSFIRQHYHYGYGSFLFHRLEAERHHRGFRIERPRFYISLFSYSHSTAIRLLILLSQVAHTIGSLSAFLNSGRSRRVRT